MLHIVNCPKTPTISEYLARNAKLLLFCVLALSTQVGKAAETDVDRWYSTDQVEKGSELFRQHCLICHGDQAQSIVANWREPLNDGSFPAPPLNGSAHAWHHSLESLMLIIDIGGTYSGGKMPAFESLLNEADKEQLIAWFQNFWSDDIYQQWQDAK
ncbi:MAG: cytochrome C oxidase Cbb3 [SAR86 cluster bacterium]|uniref:Cytochrome C oxidase Cbb3 n=1 Tax=SAR86 cluster bacterium TaxID=2030880 RepID=A0A2A5AUS5_9GAMM|nr:MAG: cytochrome C oxidase Cbb3 [SAR86 cluster bacterium]